MKRLGIQFGSVDRKHARALPLEPGMVNVIDADTGEVIENVVSVRIAYSVNDAVLATVEFYPTRLDGLRKELMEAGLGKVKK